MLNMHKQIKDNTTKAIENAQHLMSMSFENIIQITNKQIEISKQMLNESVNNFKMLAEVKNPQDFANYMRNCTASAIEKASTHYLEFYNIMNANKAKISDFIAANYDEYNSQYRTINDWINKYSQDKISSVHSTVDSVAKHTDEAIERVKELSSQTQKAVEDNIKKTVKMVEDVVENTKITVTKNAETVINSAKELSDTVIKATEANARLATNKVIEAVKKTSQPSNVEKTTQAK